MQAFQKVIAASVLAAGLAGSVGVAQADVIFTLGNNPQPGQENVLFASSQTGTTIGGITNQTNTPVQFTSTQSLSTGGVGQAFLEPTSGTSLFNNFNFSVPGGSFSSLIFNPQIGGQPQGGGGTALVTAFANDGVFNFSYDLGNGNNFLTISTANGETLSSVTVLTPGGFNQLQQVRVGLATTPVTPVTPPTTVPEPMSLALFGMGLAGLGMVRRARRKA